MKVTKTAILKELKLDNMWNRTHTCFGFKVGGVMWHKNAWKLIDTDNFDEISDWKDKSHIIKEFYEQRDLANYIYEKLTA